MGGCRPAGIADRRRSRCTGRTQPIVATHEERSVLWRTEGCGPLIGLVVRRCGLPDGLRPTGEKSSSVSGGGSLKGCPARTPRSRAACRHRWGPGGSVRVAGCRRSASPRRRGGICRSPSVRRSRCCAPKGAGCETSPVSWSAPRPRSHVSCGVTPPPAVAAWTTGPRPRSGRPARPAPQGRQTRRERPAAQLRSRQARRHGHRSLRDPGSRPAGALDRTASRAPPGPALGDLLEPRADRGQAWSGLPRGRDDADLT